jgi:predicted metalloprotease
LGGGGVRLGLGGTLILLILSVIFKRDFFSLFNAPDSGLPAASGTRVNRALDAREEPLVQFVSFVLDDAQNTWRQILLAKRVQYQDAKLVLFRDAVDSACGFAQSATGPFYCPVDQKCTSTLGFMTS